MKQKGMHFDKRVRAVTEAAATLFSTRGFIETSMEEIAQSAQMSKGGIYHYFESKTEILDAVVSHFMDNVLADIEDHLAGLENAEEKLSFLVRRHVDIYIRHMHAARVLLKAANNLPSSEREQLTSKERRYYNAVAGVITPFLGKSPDKGVLTATTFSLLGMCNWIYSWYDPKGPIDPERLSEIIIAIFTGGIRSVGQYATIARETTDE